MQERVSKAIVTEISLDPIKIKKRCIMQFRNLCKVGIMQRILIMVKKYGTRTISRKTLFNRGYCQ